MWNVQDYLISHICNNTSPTGKITLTRGNRNLYDYKNCFICFYNLFCDFTPPVSETQGTVHALSFGQCSCDQKDWLICQEPASPRLLCALCPQDVWHQLVLLVFLQPSCKSDQFSASSFCLCHLYADPVSKINIHFIFNPFVICNFKDCDDASWLENQHIIIIIFADKAGSYDQMVPPEILRQFHPEWEVPQVGETCHWMKESNTTRRIGETCLAQAGDQPGQDWGLALRHQPFLVARAPSCWACFSIWKYAAKGPFVLYKINNIIFEHGNDPPIFRCLFCLYWSACSR